ncbi:diguanylate cyclase [Bradyrhizobium genosp. L]|uniref:diguanylate cyclase n=1 Tax=Bradyrhizobium genosp. L TaxID=83637 RepID=UPI0018A286CA|nr:diguanylate cyclase [Bradyrhizobium genosp. L]QPF86378.1 diguanylate cyclase [Bradyrhizobium genosp. L]
MDPTNLPLASPKLPSPFSSAAIITAVAAVMTACVLGLVVWKALDARSMALAQGERDIRNLTHSLAEHASHSIQAADVAMSGMVDLLKYQRPREDRFNLYLRNTVATLPQIREMGVLNSEGNWIYSSLDQSPHHNNGDRAYFIAHRDSPDPSLHISDPLHSRLTGRDTIILSRRITSQDGSFGGVMLAAIDEAYFDSFYQAFKFGPHAGISLLRTDGTVLAHWPEGKWNNNPSTAFKAKIGDAQSGYAKTVSPFDGYSKYLGYERASLYPLVVTVALPEEDVLAAWHETLRYDAMAAIIVMGMVTMLALLLSTQFRRRARIEAVLREREASYRLLADNVADVVIRLDRAGKFVFVSQSVEAILGRKPADLIGQSCFAFVHPDSLADVTKATADLTDWKTTRTVEFKTQRADGSEVWVEINLKLAGAANDHRAIEVVGVLRDVTQRRSMEDELSALNARLSDLATTDGLTGLANRRSFDVALPREFRDREQISLIMVDIDHFKGFNDSQGHQAGDECLRRVARVIADATDNTTALAARYGGEEFAIILPGVGEQDALKVAEAIRLTVRSLTIPNLVAARGRVSISLGVGSRSAAITGESELLRLADLALYEAKNSGRDRTVLASSLAGDNHSAGRKQYA